MLLYKLLDRCSGCSIRLTRCSRCSYYTFLLSLTMCVTIFLTLCGHSPFLTLYFLFLSSLFLFSLRQRIPDVHHVDSVFRRCTRCHWLCSVLRCRPMLVVASLRGGDTCIAIDSLCERERERSSVPKVPPFAIGNKVLAQTNRLDDIMIALSDRRKSRVKVPRDTKCKMPPIVCPFKAWWN